MAALPLICIAGSLVLAGCANDPRSMLPWGHYKYRGASALPRHIELPPSTQSALPADLVSASSSGASYAAPAYATEPQVLAVGFEDASPSGSVFDDRIHYPASVRGIQPPRMVLPDEINDSGHIWSDAVVARVNGAPILLSELKEAALDSQLPLTDLELTGMSGDTYRRSITSLVDNLLLVQEARREEIEPNEIEVGRQVDEWLTRVVDGMGGEEQFHRKLKTAGLDAESLRGFMVRRETEKILAGRIVSSRVTVNSQEVRDFVEAQKNEGQPSQQVKLAQIFLTCPASDQETKPGRDIFYTAVGLAQQAQAAPDSFGELAREHSEDAITRADGGFLGWLAPDSMRAFFRDRVVEMRVGEVSEPIAGPDGYHVLYLVERRTPRDLLFAQRFDAERTRLVTHLRETSAIEIYPFNDYIGGPVGSLNPIVPPSRTGQSSVVRVGLSDVGTR